MTSEVTSDAPPLPTAMAPISSDNGALEAAVDAAVGALLVDKDVASIDVVEGSLPEVVRRGRRERLQILVEGDLFALLRQRLEAPDLGNTNLDSVGNVGNDDDDEARRDDDDGTMEVRLRGGLQLFASFLVDGRIALSILRPPPTDVDLQHLVEEGLLPAGVDAELRSLVLAGQGVLVIGALPAARRRLAVAIARNIAPQLRVVSINDAAVAHGVPAPVGDDVLTRARRACRLGADVLFGLDLDAKDIAALARWPLPVPLLASVPLPTIEPLETLMAPWPLRTVCGATAVVGRDPEGHPRLMELHGGLPDAAPSGNSNTPTTTSTPADFGPSPGPLRAVPDMAEVMAPTSSTGAMPSPLPPLPKLRADDAPPAEWASQNMDDDPGWELGPIADEPPAGASSVGTPSPGSFDAALKSAAERPVFQPRAPAPHPQVAALKGTGGLSLGPPGGDDSGSDS